MSNVQQLTYLQRLELKVISLLPSLFSKLPNLQSLCLRTDQVGVCDLTYATQLTYLKIVHTLNITNSRGCPAQRVILPASAIFNLLCLQLTCHTQEPVISCFDALLTPPLEVATKLHSLTSDALYSQNSTGRLASLHAQSGYSLYTRNGVYIAIRVAELLCSGEAGPAWHDILTFA